MVGDREMDEKRGKGKEGLIDWAAELSIASTATSDGVVDVDFFVCIDRSITSRATNRRKQQILWHCSSFAYCQGLLICIMISMERETIAITTMISFA